MDRRVVRGRAFAARPAVAPYQRTKSSSSYAAEKPPKEPAKSTRRPIRLHHLCKFDQPNRRRELGILHCRCYAPGRLRVRQVRRHFENLLGEMIDAVKKAAAAGYENTGAKIINERLLIEPALEELKGFAQAQVNDRVQRFSLDLLSGKAGVVF